MSNAIKKVEDWLEELNDSQPYDLPHPPVSDIEAVLEHAKKSDDYIRAIYQVIGFMFKDASTAMQQGRTDKYREQPLDFVFDRVNEIIPLPRPLDMTPSMEEIPDAATELPSIIIPH